MTIKNLVSSLSLLSVKLETIGNRKLARECMELANGLVDDVSIYNEDVLLIYDPLDRDPYISTGNFVVYRTENLDDSIYVFVSEDFKNIIDKNNLTF